jgi:hypothetical protein
MTPTGGKTMIYPVIKQYPINDKGGAAGHIEMISYSSDKKHRKIPSRRCDVEGIGSQANLEAHTYMTWPTDLSTCAKGHAELAIKFWGPDHRGSSCCYCFTSAVPTPNGKGLQLGFGGEGPHPATSTIKGKGAKLAMTIPLVAGKTYGIKGVIWKTPTGAHQETWYDDGSGWKKAGYWDRGSCGKDKTSKSPHPNSEVEFRCDCANVVFSRTVVAAINPTGQATS